MERWQFGTGSDGQAISAFRLISKAGFQAVILNYGAILQSLHLPNGRNIALGFEDWERYEKDTDYIGRIIGPNANRIVEARFQIDGDEYSLATNDGAHNLHSGPNGFDTRIWNVSEIDDGLSLGLETAGGQNGFPGTRKAVLKITLIENKLRLEMEVTTDSPTPVNLTWHPYWNLSDGGRIDGHNLRVDAETYTKLAVLRPLPINNTRHDFRKILPLGSVRLDSNYENVKSARLVSGQTEMTVTSSLPDMQVYTGDSLSRPRTGIALEPQFRPNDINFAQASLLRPDETYSHWIEYQFDEI